MSGVLDALPDDEEFRSDEEEPADEPETPPQPRRSPPDETDRG